MSIEVGKRYQAKTTTRTEQSVVIEVTAVDEVTKQGTYVYGYRRHRGSRPRQTMYPQLYFIPAEES